MKKLKVNEIFNSIDGEGRRAGELTSFIRLTGCNLRCTYCDSIYTFHEGEEMEIEDIVKKVSYKNVTLTGGEPLYQDVHGLLDRLTEHDVNIETNGSILIIPYMRHKNAWFTIDYKCGCSGMSKHMLEDNFWALRKQDVLKFVVGSQDDLDQAHNMCSTYEPKAQVYISPVFGKIEPRDIVAYMKKHNLQNWRIQLQLHKFIWDPMKRGV